MAVIEIAKIQVRRGKENTDSGVPQLAPGEFGWAQDTENLYIGKRIAEGANTDDNSRILTQKDYDNLFSIVMGAGRTAVASTSTYRYRDDLNYSLFASTTTFIGAKLDAFVSLTDFGVSLSNTATDIYLKLNTAIQSLYSNIYFHGNVRRTLKIPAGCYYLSDTVDLPPFASLEGEGPGLTYILSLNNNKPLFRTVDGQGNTFNGSMQQQSQFSSKNVQLKNLTLAFTTNTAILPSLINLDNTEDSTIESVEFTRVGIVDASTGTIVINSATSITEYGVGINLRGQRRIGVEQNNNIRITDCKFQNIGIGVLGTGSVANATIEESVFSELTQGIKFDSFVNDSLGLAPSKTNITKNIFNNITREAIYVGESTNQNTKIPNILNHSSSFNVFNRVGNGSALGDSLQVIPFNRLGSGTGTTTTIFISTSNIYIGMGVFGSGVGSGSVVTDVGSGTITVSVPNAATFNSENLTLTPTTGTAIITCLGQGFNSVNDRFSRKDFANPNFNSNSSFFYRPLVRGNAVVDAGSNIKVKNLTIGKQIIDKLFVSDKSISYKIPYSLYEPSANNYYSRSGVLTVNVLGNPNYIAPSGSASDYYDYSYEESWFMAGNFQDDEFLQPILRVEPGNNNSHLNLVYEWPVSIPPSNAIAVITGITNASSAVVTTQANHGLSSGTLVVLANVQGMSNYFVGDQAEVYVSNVTTNTFVINYPLPYTPLDTTSLGPFVFSATNTATVQTLSGVGLDFQYQVNIIS